MNDKFAFDDETGRMAFTTTGCMERHNQSRDNESKPDVWNKLAGVREYRQEQQLLAKAKALQAKGYEIKSMSIEEFVETYGSILANDNAA